MRLSASHSFLLTLRLIIVRRLCVFRAAAPKVLEEEEGKRKKAAMSDKSGAPVARTVLQQCVGARLQVRPAEETREAEWVQIERGMVVYICFFKGATDEILPKMVSTLLNIRLCESDSGKMVSVCELPGSMLVVPQATLGGRAKGRAMQYHSNIGKEDGLRLYTAFVDLCQKELAAAALEASDQVTVKHGTYGNRQVLKMDTNGPYTHLMEF